MKKSVERADSSCPSSQWFQLENIPYLRFLKWLRVGPDYHKPDAVISDAWSSDPVANIEQPLDNWWEAFNDDLLTKYIELSAKNNFDIQAAESNILRARMLRQIEASKLFPQISFDLNGTKTYFSKRGPVFEIGQAAGDSFNTSSTTTGLPFVIQIPQIQNLFNAIFDASWELDLFGKTRRTIEATTAAYESLIDYKNDILLTTLGEVAYNYMNLRANQEKERLLKRNIELYEQQAEIVRLSLQYGYLNQLDVETVEGGLALARAALPDTYSEIYLSIYTLSVLTGTLPETLVEELLAPRPLPTRPEKLALGLRSDLLRRRPDIRYAERRLAEATAYIGVAVSSFFPTISLLANGGLQSLVLPKLFEWGSRTWAYGADVNMPIFQGGRLIGNLQLSRAEQAMQAANYQQAVLNAFQDAESSLKKYQEKVVAAKEYQNNVRHQTYVVAITRERFNKGLINVIDLLNNEKQLISAELKELQSQVEELLSLVAVYKSLGGNWDAGAPADPCPPEPCSNEAVTLNE